MAGRPRKIPSYQVKVTLRGVKPPVWRRLLLPGQWHLGQVHLAIQAAMGWEGYHLHEFDVDGEVYGEPSPDDSSFGRVVRREATAVLRKVLPEVGAWLRYTYDFGDDWEHLVVVEALGDPVERAACTGGRRACPPEDCGGAWGYAELLAALADPAHPEHAERTEWVGDPFDPAAFDRESTDGMLARIS